MDDGVGDRVELHLLEQGHGGLAIDVDLDAVGLRREDQFLERAFVRGEMHGVAPAVKDAGDLFHTTQLLGVLGALAFALDALDGYLLHDR